MTQKLDYSREDAMQILNNVNCSDEEKRNQYNEYMNELKKKRKNAIVTKLNDLAREIPTITKDIYISILKKYENDDLSIPFEVIESELDNFEKEMRRKYDEYLNLQNEEEEEEILPDVIKEETNEIESMNFDDTIFSNPSIEEEIIEEELKPSFSLTNEMSVLNEEPELLAKPLFTEEESMEMMPEDDDSEKGNASAIIISIIAVIIGAVVMYSIIRLN